MKKLLFVFIFMLSFTPAISYAADSSAALAGMQRQLTEINNKLDLILVGQKRLSEEHSSIKKWIHKR